MEIWFWEHDNQFIDLESLLLEIHLEPLEGPTSPLIAHRSTDSGYCMQSGIYIYGATSPGSSYLRIYPHRLNAEWNDSE